MRGGNRRTLLTTTVCAALLTGVAMPGDVAARSPQAPGQPSAQSADSTAPVAQMTVSPLIIDLELKPGQTVHRTVTVTASGTAPIEVMFEHADFGFAPDSYELQIIEDTAEETVPFSTRGWFSVPKVSYRIRAGQSVDVPLRITAPENARPGTHLGAAFFRTVSRAADSDSTNVVTSARSGPLVFVAIEGGSEPKPRLEAFEAPRITGGGPIGVRVRLGNEGETHYRFHGTLRLDGGDGDGATLELPERYAMPGQDRDLSRQAEDGSSSPLEVGERGLSAGRHVVQLELVTQPGGTRLKAERTVWVVPTWLQAVLALLALGIAGGAALAWRTVNERRLLAAAIEHDGEWTEDDADELGDDEDADDWRHNA